MANQEVPGGTYLRPLLKTRSDISEGTLLSWFFNEFLLYGKVVDAVDAQASSVSRESVAESIGGLWMGINIRYVAGIDREGYDSEAVCLMKMCIRDYESLFMKGIDDRWVGIFMALLAERLHQFNCQDGVPIELALDLVSAPKEQDIVGFEISFKDVCGFTSCREQLDRQTLLRVSFPSSRELLGSWFEGLSDLSIDMSVDGSVGDITRCIPISTFLGIREDIYGNIRIPLGYLDPADKGWVLRIGAFKFKGKLTDSGFKVTGGGLR